MINPYPNNVENRVSF